MINYTAGQLIKSGKFKEAIFFVLDEIELALDSGVLTKEEMKYLLGTFMNILLNPSDFDLVQKLGDKFIALEMRIPNFLPTITKEEYYNNIKLNYENFKIND